MPATCKNCSHKVTDNFCAHCGQPADTGRINMRFLWEEVQSQVFSFDKGILYTSRQLFLRPGDSIRAYFAGKRAAHVKPIALVVILTGFFSLLYGILGINTLNSEFWTEFAKEFNDPSTFSLDIKGFIDFKNNHSDLLELAFLPLYSLGSYLIFIKYKYNFAEHLVLNSFITTQKLVVNILLLPLFSIFNSNPEVFDWLGALELTIGMVITVRVYSSFFNKGSTVGAIFKSFLVYITMFFECFLIFILYAVVLGVIEAVKIQYGMHR